VPSVCPRSPEPRGGLKQRLCRRPTIYSGAAPNVGSLAAACRIGKLLPTGVRSRRADCSPHGRRRGSRQFFEPWPSRPARARSRATTFKLGRDLSLLVSRRSTRAVACSAPATPPQPWHHHAPPPQPPYLPTPARTNGFAIASLVLGIVWIWWIGSTLALIFGYVGKSQIDRSGGMQGGRGLAIAGIVLGWVGIGVLLLIIVLGISFALAE
jgi:Domain of unknown function (DUF4190)